MGSFWMMWKLRIVAVLVVGLICGGVWYRHHVWQQGYDDAVAVRAATDAVAVLAKTKSNELEVAAKSVAGVTIERKHDEELYPVRQRITAAPRLRPGTGICGPAAASQGSGTSVSATSGSSGGLVREDVDRDLRALKTEMEEVAGTARACQEKLKLEGFMP